ncbi:uncharacterized protein [Battus philenor]|uniref:uncharacterized protein isoform X3 n=1 Tax=Battus philenor TaxID=42288 RepID=UPI0035CEC7BB
MKSKKRHHSSSEDSDDSNASEKSSSSSDTESDDSSVSEHRYKKKRKRAESFDSDSNSEDLKRSKKRKHKKKKKKHSKKKKRSESAGRGSVENISSLSEGEIISKKKRKHKHIHTKRTADSSHSEEEVQEHRLHSVVKECQPSSDEGSQPSRTYYQNARFEERRPEEEYHRRQREQPYNPREDHRPYNRYNQYEDRGAPKRREIADSRDYRERRGPADVERYREREYGERREKYHEERYSDDRPREFRRERPPRIEKPPALPHSSVDSYKDKNRRLESREEREEGRPMKERLERVPRGDEERRDRTRSSEDRPRDNGASSRPRERKSRFADLDDKKEYDWGKVEVKKEGKSEGDKEKPNFGLSGKLTADTNTVNGVVIKYSEPDDAKQPKRRWRFYPFKGDKALPILYIHRQSCFLIGRDKKVVDISLEHPSISKQHAALQYRATPFTRPDGTQGRRVRPYIIDLESANGTFVNNKKIEPRRYVELLERDVVKFGFSQREYVLLHENSKDDAQDDDNQEPPSLGAGVTTTDQIKQEKRIKEEMAADGD